MYCGCTSKKYTSRTLINCLVHREIDVLSFDGKLVLPTERVQCSNLSTLHNLHQFTKSTTCFDKYTHITTNRVPMVVTYHPSLPNIGSILRKLQPLLHCSQKYRKAIKDVPFMAFRKPKSLGDYLVHTKLRPSTRLERSSKGTEVCVNRRCQVCKSLKLGEKFTSYRTGKSYTINYELDCNSGNVVYLLSCKGRFISYGNDRVGKKPNWL